MTVSSVWTVSPWARRVVGTIVFSGPSEARVLFDPYSASGVISEIAADELREALQSAIPDVRWRVTAGPQIGSTVGGPVGHLLVLGDAFTAEEPETEEKAAALVAALEKVKAKAEAAAASWAQNSEAMCELLESVEASIEPVAWITEGGDVTRSHALAVERSFNRAPLPLYLMKPTPRE